MRWRFAYLQCYGLVTATPQSGDDSRIHSILASPMRLTLIQLSTFAAKWSKMRLDDDDLRDLEGGLMANPEAGAVIPGAGGLRKLRFAPPSWHTGKRGATRVIYAFIAAGEAIYFFTLYGKNERS